MDKHGLTQDQIERLQRYVEEIQHEGHGMVIIMVENGVARYIIPAPSLDFLPGKSLEEYREKRKELFYK